MARFIPLALLLSTPRNRTRLLAEVSARLPLAVAKRLEDLPRTNRRWLIDNIEVALDVSTNGKLPLPPYDDDASSQIYNINIFLYSYDTGRNFTITNGTASANNATLGDIMLSEPGSTVKHVKWTWPDCLVGDGYSGEDRGSYNVSLTRTLCA